MGENAKACLLCQSNDGISNTELNRRFAMGCVSNHSQPNDSKLWLYSIFIPHYSTFWDFINPKY